MSEDPHWLDLAHVRRALAGQAPHSAPPADHKHAAVALVLRRGRSDGDDATAPSGGVEVLLIRRAERDDDPWSGHMAFPGGRREERDLDLVHTARRETHEEVGLELERNAEYLGPLPPLQAVGRSRVLGMTISPHVFELSGDDALTLNHEVMEALWVPLSPLALGEVATTLDYPYQGQVLKMPAYEVKNTRTGRSHVVWGLTHRMLETFFDVLRATVVA
jgi:8-oxo-dGTP pyrophosphatase MutT (NUDIX family)